uniref:Uncharacterized protein n=1 Tax=Cacopsylla melanoneura TaxID=428564 RepID=A0A8D8ZS58_9HEMI
MTLTMYSLLARVRLQVVNCTNNIVGAFYYVRKLPSKSLTIAGQTAFTEFFVSNINMDLYNLKGLGVEIKICSCWLPNLTHRCPCVTEFPCHKDIFFSTPKSFKGAF